MLAEYGTLSLEDVLAPSIQMAEEGYPIEAQAVRAIEREKKRIKEWPYARAVMLPHPGRRREAPRGRASCSASPTSRRRCASSWRPRRQARKRGQDRKAALYAAYDRFYKGDIAQEFVRGAQRAGRLFTAEDLATWKVRIEEPVKTRYKDIDVYKLTTWVQGPAMLQALNILETLDLKSMGYNCARYVHAVYQAMSLAFADRDFYYGDPVLPARRADRRTAVEGLRARAREDDPLGPQRSRREARRPVSVPGRDESLRGPAREVEARLPKPQPSGAGRESQPPFDDAFYAGTTSVQAADGRDGSSR